MLPSLVVMEHDVSQRLTVETAVVAHDPRPEALDQARERRFPGSTTSRAITSVSTTATGDSRHDQPVVQQPGTPSTSPNRSPR